MRSCPRPLFWAAAVFAFVMAVVPHPPRRPGAPSDEVQHVVAFASLGLLATLASRHTSVLKLPLCLSSFGAAIETLQFIPQLYRDGNVVDWVVDTLSATIAIIVARSSEDVSAQGTKS